MKESYGEGLATHTGPESCGTAREGVAEALTGARAGRVLSRESNLLRSADAVGDVGRQNRQRRYRETLLGSARSETPCTYGNTLLGNREILWLPTADGVVGRVGKSKDVRRR
jgi:RNA-directed DNA polymerase